MTPHFRGMYALIVIGGLLGVLLCPSATAQRYRVVNVGDLGGGYGGAAAINSLGQVAGTSDSASGGGNPHAFLYSLANGIADLGCLPGQSMSQGNAINSSGVVAGHAWTADGYYHAALFSSGTVTDLGTLGGHYSSANGINVSGTVAGFADVVDPYTLASYRRGFVYTGGVMTAIGTLGGTSSEAWAINDQGNVAGVSGTSGAVNHAFLLQGGSMIDLGTLGGDWSQAYDINDAGQVVGRADNASGIAHAFLYDGGSMHDLGVLPNGGMSEARGINNLGDVVGASGGGTTWHAFLYTKGTLVDLNSQIDSSTGWTLTWARDINDNGQIAGVGMYQGQTLPFLLQPLAQDVTSLVQVQVGRLRYDRKTQTYRQSVTIKNPRKGSAIAGPVTLVLDNLAGGTLMNADGQTTWTLPKGSPFVNLDIGTDNLLSPRESVTANLEFSSSSGAISFTVRVLGGFGDR